MSNISRNVVGKPEENIPLGSLGVDGSVRLKYALKQDECRIPVNKVINAHVP
jgi:hypothetical protein